MLRSGLLSRDRSYCHLSAASVKHRNYLNVVKIGLRVFWLVWLATAAAFGQSASITAASATYATGGGAVTFTATISYASQPTALGFTVELPAGWSYAGGANEPSIKPRSGATGTLEWVFPSGFGTGSSAFTFSANYSAGLSGSQTITASALYRTPLSNLNITPVVLSSASAGTTPIFLAPPVSQGVTAGGNVSFSVAATGTPAPTLVWQLSMDGGNVWGNVTNSGVYAGATAATLTITGATVGMNGYRYRALATNSVQSNVASAAASLTVNKAALTAKADDQMRVYGTSNPALTISYTGFVNGETTSVLSALPTAATTATISSLPGTYPITISGGSVANYMLTLQSGTLTITPRDYSGVYFGTFAGGGHWALYVRANSTATYIAYLPSRHSAIIASLTVNIDGTFTVTGTEIKPLASAVTGLSLATPESPQPKTSLAAGDFALTGSIGFDGALTGALTGLGETLTGTLESANGPAQNTAGLYTATALGTATGSTYTIVGASGQAFVVTANSSAVDGATGTVNTSGQLTATTSNNAQLTLTINAAALTLNASITPAGSSTPVIFAGVPDTVIPNGYLSNLSVRAVMTSGQTLIVGFVVDGGAKPMLVRAAGPALNHYGLTGVVDPRLALYNGGTLVTQNDNWDASLSPAFYTLGAFAFDSASKDAALQQSISGPHTAQATATGAGAILVEAYDAGPNDTRKLTNLSARFQVGTGDNILIAGFVVAGTGTRQVLIRAVGPTLAGYGVPGTLVDPQFTVFDGGTSLASNNDWSSSLAPTFDTLGAFQLTPNSKDAAIVVTLQAGKTYTVQVSGVGGTTGEALVEIYLVP